MGHALAGVTGLTRKLEGFGTVEGHREAGLARAVGMGSLERGLFGGLGLGHLRGGLCITRQNASRGEMAPHALFWAALPFGVLVVAIG